MRCEMDLAGEIVVRAHAAMSEMAGPKTWMLAIPTPRRIECSVTCCSAPWMFPTFLNKNELFVSSDMSCWFLN